MKNAILIRAVLMVVLAAVMAGCEDFPIEGGGEDDLSGAAHHRTQAHPGHGGMDEGLLRSASGR